MLLDLSCVVLMTEEESRTVTGISQPQAAARAVLDRPHSKTEWCVIKRGSQGSMLLRRGDDTVYTAPGLPVTVVDTVGCGDSFASAIVMGYINKHDVPSTLLLANAVGAATATGRGAGRNVANAHTVTQLLQAAQSAGVPHAASALELLKASLSAAAMTT